VATTAAADPLDEDGINPARALILHAYWGLRREHPPSSIGCREIAAWIRAHERDQPLPSASLIQLTLDQAGLARRPPGRPSKASCLPPFCPATEPRKRKRSRT
jgi:hypothetical protein